MKRVGDGKSNVLTDALVSVVVVDAGGLAVLLDIDVAVVGGAVLTDHNGDRASSEGLEHVVVPGIVGDKTALRSTEDQGVSLCEE